MKAAFPEIILPKSAQCICLALLACITSSVFGQVPHFPIVTGDSTGTGITYNDIAPDVELSFETPADDTFWVDLDFDNVPDMYATRNYYNGQWFYWHMLEIHSLPGTELYCKLDTSFSFTHWYPLPNSIGILADSNLAWTNHTAYLYSSQGSAPNFWEEFKYWVELWDRFLAFRITKPSGVYYGWMRIRVEEGEFSADYPTFFQSWAIANGQTVGTDLILNELDCISCGPLPTNGPLHLKRTGSASGSNCLEIV